MEGRFASGMLTASAKNLLIILPNTSSVARIRSAGLDNNLCPQSRGQQAL